MFLARLKTKIQGRAIDYTKIREREGTENRKNNYPWTTTRFKRKKGNLNTTH